MAGQSPLAATLRMARLPPAAATAERIGEDIAFPPVQTVRASAARPAAAAIPGTREAALADCRFPGIDLGQAAVHDAVTVITAYRGRA